MNNYKSRFDRKPRVKVPMVSEVYFAWCFQDDKLNWEQGDDLIQPSGFYNREYPTSVEAVETGREDHYELDYEKDPSYYKDHHIMLVMKYRKEDREYTIFLTPEHIHGIIEHSINCDEYGVIIQPEYSWEELQTDSIHATSDTEGKEE